jgi:hypothetical protein
MLTTFNTTYATQAAETAYTLKTYIENLNRVHLAFGRNFDPTYHTAFTEITKANVCDYLEDITGLSSNRTTLISKTVCGSINSGWGKEVW